MSKNSLIAIHNAMQGIRVFCKFLSANDTGETGAHQSGIYISHVSAPILFCDELGVKGQNKDKWVKIKWNDDFETNSRFIYYGQGTRNEYRITNFGRDFPYLKADFTGSLFVLIQNSSEEYQGFVLVTEEEINDFLNAFAISPIETNSLIQTTKVNLDTLLQQEINQYIKELNLKNIDFPTASEMSQHARDFYNSNVPISTLNRPNAVDTTLLSWIKTEYQVFRAIETARYGHIVANGFKSVDEFILLANQVLNRRKSRAGKGFESHLAATFTMNGLTFAAQAITEGKKRPDFLFPSKEAYHDLNYPSDKLIMLAAKTTCKDRWRQILNEADRLKCRRKFLCTLQQGISAAQMDEMDSEQVTLVVPQLYIKAYPRDRQNRIWTLSKFIQHVKAVEQGL